MVPRPVYEGESVQWGPFLSILLVPLTVQPGAVILFDKVFRRRIVSTIHDRCNSFSSSSWSPCDGDGELADELAAGGWGEACARRLLEESEIHPSEPSLDSGVSGSGVVVRGVDGSEVVEIFLSDTTDDGGAGDNRSVIVHDVVAASGDGGCTALGARCLSTTERTPRWNAVIIICI